MLQTVVKEFLSHNSLLKVGNRNRLESVLLVTKVRKLEQKCGPIPKFECYVSSLCSHIKVYLNIEIDL